MARPDGIDITAQDFIREHRAFQATRESSQVQKFFSGTNVFITGGTGFVGKALIEKLLRVTEVSNIYLMVRPKFGKSATDRLTELLNTQKLCPNGVSAGYIMLHSMLQNVEEHFFYLYIFRDVKVKNPGAIDRVKMIVGDLSLPGIGLDPDDEAFLIENVEVVLHAGATEIFDTRLRLAIETNVRGTRDLVHIVKQMKQLKAFIHVSSAYSNCPEGVIDEKIYSPPTPYKNLLELLNLLDEDSLNALEQTLLKDWPNPYTFTKQVSESMVAELARGLPVAILRPGIAVCSASEPTVGWVDSLMGPEGIIYSAYIGCQRVIQADEKCRVDLVPVDYIANAILALTWDVGSTRDDIPNLEQLSYNDALLSSQLYQDSDIEVVNLVSGVKNPLTWGIFLRHCLAESLGLPSVKQFSVPNIMIKSNAITVFFYQLYLHVLPALLFDLFYSIKGGNSMFTPMYRKLHDYSYASSYFSLREWNFSDNNAWILWDKLSARDKVIFNYDIGALVWTEYLRILVRGLRIYIAGDEISTLPEANQHLSRLRIQYYLGWTVTYLIIALLFYIIIF